MKIRQITKSLVSGVVGAATLLQVPQVADVLKSAVAHHPHISSIVAAAITIAALLHNPVVIRTLGLEKKEVTSEVVAVADAGHPPQD